MENTGKFSQETIYIETFEFPAKKCDDKRTSGFEFFDNFNKKLKARLNVVGLYLYR